MKNKKTLWGVLALIAAVAIAFGIYTAFGPQGTAGGKNITVDVVTADATETFEIASDAEFLRGALESIDLVQGEESAYGLFVLTVNGVTVNADNQEWWCFTKGGETLMTGVDDTPIADGDAFEITLTVGY